MPQRTELDAVLAPRIKTRYIPITAKQMLMRICSCSFLRRFLKEAKVACTFKVM